MRKNLVAIIAILTICSLTIVSFATDLNGLEEKRNEITNQLQGANNELNEVQTQVSTTMQELQELNEKIASYETEIESLQNESVTLTQSITELEQKLAVSEENYNKQFEASQEIIVKMYESGETTYLDVLLGSSSISEFISNYFLLSEITNMNMQILEDIEREKTQIATNKEMLQQQKDRLKSVRNNRERTAIVLENTKVLRNQYLASLTEEEQALQAKIEEYEKQMEEIEAEILLLTAANLDENYTGGIMAWPVPGYTRITSEFGMRLHPILNVYKLHTGIDIGAPMGANFIAASDGVVVKAGENAAYGNMVVIDHGGGISTLYAHGSEILVTVGQEVKRGQAVLKVGSTGYSTGPHAHFEVRVNGEYVQPLNFLMSQDNQNNQMNQTN